ncbi:MAG: hypothetical protein ACRDJE_20810 [Dehalococcoidia bacterium]
MPSRVEREIEEILSKLDADAPSRPPTRLRRSWRSRVRRLVDRIPRPHISFARLNAGTLMLWGIGLILSALLLRVIAPDLTRWAVIAGLILFFGSFVLAFVHKDGGAIGSSETYWRGQRIQRTELRGPSTIDRIKAWWRGRNRGR